MAESSGSPTHHLRILVQPPKADSSGWEVAVYLGDTCFAKNVTLSDPFTKADEDECRWYLEDYLTKSPFEKARAGITAELLNSYADSLFDQLHLSRVWRRLTGPTSPKHKVLEIDIVEDTEDSNAVFSDTVHRLHWEVLEYPRLWKNLNIRTTVRRIIPQKETSVLSIKRVESWSRGVPTVNILLIVSRKLVSQGGEEVDPNLAFQSMQTLKRDLEARDAAFRLNIEIVRPGSFKALKKHLDERSRHRRNGDIHIVHFDVHGQVGLRSEKGQEKVTTAAFLYFQSGKGDGTLAPTRAGAVAELLRKNNIRIVVLNACESAKANKGDEANIARTFTKAGVQNVLAMAYKSLGSTCTQFMRCFYESLITHGKPFSVAVRDAREHLRASPNRDARFALNRPLEDWIVPVVYASGKDVELRISAPPEELSQVDTPFLTVPKENPTTLTPSPLVGRGFDVLRFETMFLASRITGLSGAAGVGKTAFIRHLLRGWEDTGLFENTLYVDCSSIQTKEIHTPEALVRHFLGEKHNPSLPTATGPEQTVYLSTIAELRDNYQVIVFDNLEASHSDVNEMNDYGRWSERTRAGFLTLIRDVVSVRSEEEDAGVSFILVGRSDEDAWWMKRFTELPTFPRYRLNSLSLPDAIEFAHNLLRDHGLDRSQWGHEDEDVLLQVLNILQCNPLAIETVLEAAASRELPWKKLFETILFHQYVCLEPVASDGRSFLTRDITAAYLSGPGPRTVIHANLFAALALYWHQGCSKDALKNLLGVSQDHIIAPTLEFGVDRGFFSLDDRGYIVNIHPLFTLLGRCVFSSPRVLFSRPLQWALDADENSVEDLSVPWLIVPFFQAISSRKLAELIRATSLAGRFRELEKELRPAFHNILTCLRLCSVGKEPVCMGWWPEDLQTYGFAGIWFLSVDEMALLVKHYEHFLRRFISRRPKGTDALSLVLMISVGNFLTSVHLMVSTLPTKRAKEFSLLTFNLIDNTEDDLLRDQDVMGVVSQAVMRRDFADFSQGSKTLVESEFFRSAMPGLISQNMGTEADFASVTWNQFADNMPDFQQRAQQIESFIQKGNLPAQISELQKADKSGMGPVEHGVLFSRLAINASKKDPVSDWVGVAQNSDPNARSAELEKSLDVRNRAEAIKHYKALLTRAVKEYNVEEVVELFNSLIEIYRTDEAFAEDLQQALEGKKKFDSLYQALKLATSLAGAGEIPETNETLLKDIQRVGSLIPGNEYFQSTMESLFESVLKKKKAPGFGLQIERPSAHFQSLLGEWRRQGAEPEGRAKLHELSTQFRSLYYQHSQALDAEDFDKAIETWDKLVETDDPTLLPGIPLKSISGYRPMLMSSRDFMTSLATANRAVEEGRVADARVIVESLLHDHTIGNFPDLPDHLLRAAHSSLRILIWQQDLKAWQAAFNADDCTQALIEITSLRRLEGSDSFNDPMSTSIGSFFAQDFTDWNHLRTLHRHFYYSRRPRLALKTVSYLLKRYDVYESLPTPPPWLLPGHLDVERAFKWFYESAVQMEKCMQSFAELDLVSTLQHLQVMKDIAHNTPEELRGMIPEKALSQLKSYNQHMCEAFGKFISVCLSMAS